MGILLVVAAWFGLAGLIVAGWARFFRKAGTPPLPSRLEAIEPRSQEREQGRDTA